MILYSSHGIPMSLKLQLSKRAGRTVLEVQWRQSRWCAGGEGMEKGLVPLPLITWMIFGPCFFLRTSILPQRKTIPPRKKTKRSRFQHVSKTIILNEYCHNPPTNHQPTGLVSPAHNGTTVGLVPAPPALGVWGHPAGCGSSQPSLSPRFTQKNHRWYIIMVNNG
jgi:hypothetical protein